MANAAPKTETLPLTRRKKLLFGSIASLVVIIGLLVVSEVVLRVVGIGPYRKPNAAIRIEPGGTFFTKDDALGYTHIPGSFDVTIKDSLSFHATNLPNTLRITRPLETYPSPIGKPEIWIFGCSFTYGWGLDDQDTYAWLLQEALPEYEVVNFGVNGYGTLHSLIQFRQALATKKPKVAVLVYASFHDARNTFLRKRRKAVGTWNNLGPLVQPYAGFDADGHLYTTMAEVAYQEFPLMRRFAVAHMAEIVYNQCEAWLTPSRRVTEALIDETAALARANDVRFEFAFISGEPYMLEHTQRVGIPSVDLSVDTDNPEYNLQPYDNHPNASANRIYAQRLESFLRRDVARQ